MNDSNEQIRSLWNKVVYNSDSKAFELFFYLLQPKLIRFCLQYGNNRQAAEEIVSDVFVEAWLKRNEMLDVRNPEVYFLIIAKNKAVNQWKKNANIHIIEIDEECHNMASYYRPDEALEKKELMLSLDKAIDSLPNQCKVIFRMIKIERMKCAEVAEVLDISVRTVHAQTYRAMTKLNTALNGYLDMDTATKIVKIVSSIALAYFLMS